MINKEFENGLVCEIYKNFHPNFKGKLDNKLQNELTSLLKFEDICELDIDFRNDIDEK